MLEVCGILIQSKANFFTCKSSERHYDIGAKSGLNPSSVSCATLIKLLHSVLLQGIFLTHGSNLDLPHCWRILYHLSHQGSHVYALLATKGQGHLSLGQSQFVGNLVCLCFVHIAQPRLYTMWSLHSTCNPIVSILMRLNLTPFASLCF